MAKKRTKKVAKPKVEKKPEAPKVEGRKIKQIDIVRLYELRVELQQLEQDKATNLKTGAFILTAYVKEGERVMNMNLDKGVLAVALAPQEDKK